MFIKLFRIVIVSVIVCLICGQDAIGDDMSEKPSENKDNKSLVSLKQKVVDLLADKPFNINRDEIKLEIKGDDLSIKFDPRKFLVYTYTRLQGYSKDAVEVEAPTHNGIIIRLSIRENIYTGNFKLPLSSQEQYWKEYGDSFNYVDQNNAKHHLLAIIDYGRNLKLEDIVEMKKIIFKSFEQILANSGNRIEKLEN